MVRHSTLDKLRRFLYVNAAYVVICTSNKHPLRNLYLRGNLSTSFDASLRATLYVYLLYANTVYAVHSTSLISTLNQSTSVCACLRNSFYVIMLYVVVVYVTSCTSINQPLRDPYLRRNLSTSFDVILR